MQIDKRIFASPDGARKGGMEKDTDTRYIPNGFYKDARNVNFMSNGDRFTLTNIKGNANIPNNDLNTGFNNVIGSFDDKANNTIYYFTYNSGLDHQISRHVYAKDSQNTAPSGQVEILAEGSGLQFGLTDLITGIVIVEDRFLIWTDNVNEIGCLDLENLPSGSITAANRWEIELARVPDLDPLDVMYVTDENRKENVLDGTAFQFRYRYIYEDGRRSAPSTISGVPVPDVDFAAFSNYEQEFYDNAINIQVPQPSFDKVVDVELYVRYENNDNTKEANLWYKFATIPYEELPNSYAFTGNEDLEVADATEFTTEVTFFPKKCKEIVFLPSNVLAMLNFTEGLDTSSVTPQCEVYPEYNTRPTSTSATTTTIAFSNNVSSTSGVFYNPKFNIEIDPTVTSSTYDTITIGGTPKVGDVVRITLALAYIDNSGGTLPISLSGQTRDVVYVIKAEDIGANNNISRNNVAEKVVRAINSVDTRIEGFGGIVATTGVTANVGEIQIIQGENQRNLPYQVQSNTTTSTAVSITQGYPETGAQAWVVKKTEKTFKRWSTPQLAIQYMDDKGRRSGAIPIGSAFIKGQDESSNDDWVWLKVIIGHLAPSWATSYAILRTQNPTQELFLQLPVTGKSTNRISVDVFDSINAFRNTFNTDAYSYNYVDGDRIRFIGEIVDGDVTFYEDQKDYTISKVNSNNVEVYLSDINQTPKTGTAYTGFSVTYSNSPATITRASGNWSTDGFLVGQQVTITGGGTSANDGDYIITSVSPTALEVAGAFSFTGIDATASFERTSVTNGSQHIVEVWRPRKNQSKIYYEIAFQGTIDSNQRHSGNVSDQTATDGAELLLKAGDVYQVFCSHPDYTISANDSYFEFQSISPTYDAKVTDIGRSNYDTPTDKEVTRGAAITFTQPIVANSSSNGLAVVLPTSIYDQYGTQYGSIQKAFLRQNRELVLYFEDKVGRVGVFQELQKQGSDVLYTTDSLINNINYYAYEGGIGNRPESFAFHDNINYFLNPRENAVCRLAADGITVVSDYGMQSWFNDNLDTKDNFLSGLQAFGTYDERNDSYVLGMRRFIKFEVNSSGATSVNVTPLGSSSENLFEEGDKVILSNGLFPPTTYEFTVGGGIGVTFNDPDYDLVWETSPAGNTIQEVFLIKKVETLWFNEPANGWVSFLDFTPENMTTIGIDFVSFIGGEAYVHNSAASRGRFYGTNYPAEVTVPFNAAPNIQKRLQTIELEANSVWSSETDGDVSVEDGNQTSQLFETWYSEYQPNEWATAFRQDTLTPNRTNALLDGYDLRGKYLTIRLVNDDTTAAKLASATISYFVSESSL